MTTDYTCSVTIFAARGEVFANLIDNTQLAIWFCEQADVDPAAGRFDFWGRYTPEFPAPENGRHPVTAFEPLSLIRFPWMLRGIETTVEIRLEDIDGGTKVTVQHQNVAKRPLYGYSIIDFWCLSLENLRQWTERGTMGLRHDFSARKEGDAHISLDIAASPNEVYKALIDPKELERFMATTATVEPKVGGRYDVGWGGGGPVKILSLVPDKELTYTWHYPDEGDPDTVVTWTLEGSGGKTRLSIVHSGFAKDRDAHSYYVGWSAFMSYIKGMVEGGRRWTRPQYSNVPEFV